MNRTPDILNFGDHRSYLRAVYSAKKKRQPGFGLKRWAESAGLKSPATLSMILKGERRLTPALAEKLADGLSLTGRRKSYLVEMARRESSRTTADKWSSEERLLHLKSLKEQRHLTLAQYRVLSTWYHPAIYVLAGLTQFQNDPEWIVKRLGKKITAKLAAEALSDLTGLGMLREENGKLIQAEGPLTTEEDVRHLAVRRYHATMLAMAEKALSLPLEQREMNGLTIPVPQAELPQLKEKIRKFRNELNESFSRFSSAENVYQLNVHLFPLTQVSNPKDKP